jgi:Ca2+-binding EF-hand superfamily protein
MTSKTEKESYEDAFNKFKAPDGTLNSKFLGNALRYLNFDPTEKELKEYSNLADAQNKGYLTLEAFLSLITKVRKPFSIKDLEEAFDYLDKNKDHKISADEFKNVMSTQGDKLTNEEIDEIFQEIDIDGNGEINFEEFISKLLKTSN